MNHKLIVITGTPGTGKSTLAKKLVKTLGKEWKRVDLHKYYTEISLGYDKKKKCYEIDMQKLTKIIFELKKTNLIFDSHISHLLPKKLVDLCVVLTCSDLKLLKRRLQNRGYSKAKVEENLQAEIFQSCLEEAKEKKHTLCVFDVAKERDDYVTKDSMTKRCLSKVKKIV